jgi:rfaE bifunctional protein kinase chain/domain
MNFEDELNKIKKNTPQGARTVFVSGNFNILLEIVRSTNWVDHACLIHCQPSDVIKILQPNFVVKGNEHEFHYNKETEALEEYGGTLLFGSGESSFSSLDLINKQLSFIKPKEIHLPKDFPVRHNFKISDLISLTEKFSNVRIAIIGDLIIDEYIHCDPVGMSQEDPTIVVTPVIENLFLGGAGIVAANSAGLGATVDFFSVVGQDELNEFSKKKLKEYGINFHLVEDKSRPTTLKTRFRADRKTLLRVNRLRSHDLGIKLRQSLIEQLVQRLNEFDVLVFSDFNYGCLPQSLVDTITAECHQRGLMMIADSQSSSQLGNIARFKGMNLLAPTEFEARISLHDHQSGLVVLAESLRLKANANDILVKLGSEGLLFHSESSVKNKYLTDRLPAFSMKTEDTAGAGDALLATIALARSLEAPLWQAAYLGSIAAACQVRTLGNTPIQARQLLEELHAVNE